ncbi:MarR family transcriptional regulator [Nesterenkonia sp. CL21]|uniref:MarR family winged helix-turn-helix transcriptional regulator n=1 Tax=Nesterenkonia sp. CL21 TaxID=3064894 RepID=UPI0028786596|nr:MarR family transcriptional regulator [Nesterenkonia sp. CL21]MDS2172296.1 MarR family transcriptional regulator [Nesterenkonia sp. CL21]
MMHTADPADRPKDSSMIDPRVMDPAGEIVPHAHVDEEELDQIVAVLDAMRRWRTVERRMSEASRKYMKLGETDMRALRYLIAAQRHDRLATPSDLARHLGVSTASVTKMLDRLAAHDHIRRLPHPEDRRSTAIEVTEQTQRVARESVGRSHAGRFHAAAALSPDEREVVIRFLDALCATEPPPQQ